MSIKRELEDYLSPEQVAQRLGVNPVTVYRWIKERKLIASKLGRRIIRIASSEVVRFMDSRKIATKERKAA